MDSVLTHTWTWWMNEILSALCNNHDLQSYRDSGLLNFVWQLWNQFIHPFSLPLSLRILTTFLYISIGTKKDDINISEPRISEVIVLHSTSGFIYLGSHFNFCFYSLETCFCVCSENIIAAYQTVSVFYWKEWNFKYISPLLIHSQFTGFSLKG